MQVFHRLLGQPKIPEKFNQLLYLVYIWFSTVENIYDHLKIFECGKLEYIEKNIQKPRTTTLHSETTDDNSPLRSHGRQPSTQKPRTTTLHSEATDDNPPFRSHGRQLSTLDNTTKNELKTFSAIPDHGYCIA